MPDLSPAVLTAQTASRSARVKVSERVKSLILISEVFLSERRSSTLGNGSDKPVSVAESEERELARVRGQFLRWRLGSSEGRRGLK